MAQNLITCMNKTTRSTKSENDVTHAIQLKLHERMNKKWLTSYGRNKNHDDEIKKHSRTSPDIQFKEFSLTKQKKLELEWTMSELRKPFLKNHIKK